MIKPRSLSAMAALLCLFLVNCKEKENVIPQSPSSASGDNYSFIDEVFDELQLNPKTVIIDAGKDASFYGNSGTRFILKANSLTKMDGTPVTGDVQVSVTEYLDKSDMLFSKALPISNGEPLVSGGEINIKASQSGQPLQLAKGKTVQANIPQGGTPDPDMEFFEGEEKNDGGQNLVNWARPKVDTAFGGIAINNRVVMGTGDTISVFSDSLRWANADRYLKNPKYVEYALTVQAPGADLSAADRVIGYALYDDYKAVWPLDYFHPYANGVFHDPHLPSIPVHFVVFTLIHGSFYGGVKAVTPENGNNYDISIYKTTPKEFKQKLNSL